MSAPSGFVVFDGPSPWDGLPIVGLLTVESSNRKTGNMAQLWIIARDVSPLAAIASGMDAAVCGACPLRGDGTGRGRACYVELGRAPMAVWKTYQRGRYPYAGPDSGALRATLSGRKIRLGAYGDPAMLPIGLVAGLCALSDGWTGYTHQWRNCDPSWARYLMASADSVADRRAAREAGWRAFTVIPASVPLASVSGAVECMATRDRNPRQCIDCMACSGTRDGAIPKAVDIVIHAHGAGSRYVV